MYKKELDSFGKHTTKDLVLNYIKMGLKASGAFESGLTAKLMGTATAVVFGGTMTLITVITTAAVSPSFRKLDLTKDIEEHGKEDV